MKAIDSRMKKYIILLFISTILVRCIPPTEEPITDVSLDVKDKEYQRIINLQDEQKIDSLLLLTNHNNPATRFLMANAFASIQSEKALDSLYILLDDPVLKVRTAAAYAIGQIGSSSSQKQLLEAFISRDTLDVNNEYNATILESIGKVGDKSLLSSLATVSTYRNTDTLLLEGQARAIYNYALRGIIAPEATDKMIQYIIDPTFPESVRLIAANYLYRAKGTNIDATVNQLAEQMVKSENPDIRMALASRLGKVKNQDLFSTIKNQYDIEKDPTVKLTLMKALYEYPYINVIEFFLGQLKNEDVNLASAAADYLIKYGNRNDAIIYKNYLSDDLDYRIQAKVYGAILNHLPTYYANTRNGITKAINEKIESAKTPYEKSSFIEALAYDPVSYKQLFDIIEKNETPIIKTSAANAIADILKGQQFINVYKAGQKRIRQEIVRLIKNEIKNGDAGVLAVFGELMANSESQLKPIIIETEFIDTAMQKLQIPKEVESYNSLAKAKAYLTDNAYQPLTPVYNHPINWQKLEEHGDSVQVAIKTTKGVIRVKMMPYAAPGSVGNFLSLIEDNFYDGKTFHRVVPNFVIQDGCPRGDGYGALDYSIRSELSQRYYDKGGMLGMASAGLHTECTQWFITHKPAMHLNGKYTIFGEVISGMDVVKAIEVGDKIEDMIITKL